MSGTYHFHSIKENIYITYVFSAYVYWDSILCSIHNLILQYHIYCMNLESNYNVSPTKNNWTVSCCSLSFFPEFFHDFEIGKLTSWLGEIQDLITILYLNIDCKFKLYVINSKFRYYEGKIEGIFTTGFTENFEWNKQETGKIWRMERIFQNASCIPLQWLRKVTDMKTPY